MLKTAGFMAMATLLAKVCGMVRDMLIAAFFGSGMEGAAYMTASKLPTMLFDIVIGGVISASFIPVFNDIMQKESKDAAMRFAGKFITGVLMITMLIAAFGMVFKDPLITFLAPKFDTQTHDMAASLSGIMFPMIVFTGLAFSFVGILQSFGEYNIPSIISLVSNVVIIIYFVIFGKRFGVYGLAVTMVIAWSLQAVIQLPSLKRLGFKFMPSVKFRDPHIKSALMLAGPMLISTWVQPLYSIVNSRIASGMQGGSVVALLEYANRLYVIVVGVFSFVVTNLIFPKLSRANASDNKNEAEELIKNSIKAICIVILPIMAGFIILARPITSIIYERGSFTSSDAMYTSVALTFYSVGMPGLALNEIFSKAFFSMKNSKTPMINAILSMLFNIAAAYALSPIMGIGGLALATAGGSTVNALLNYICMRAARGRILDKSDIISVMKTVLSAAVMAAAVLGIKTLLSGHGEGLVYNIITVAVCAAVGAAVYFAMCCLTGVDGITDIIKGIFKRERK